MSLALSPTIIKAGNICEDCQTLDLTKAADISESEVSARINVEIGTITWFSSSCDFCRTIFETIRNLGIELSPKEINSSKLMAIPVVEKDWSDSSDDKVPMVTVWLQLIPSNRVGSTPDYFYLHSLSCRAVQHGYTLCRSSAPPKRLFQQMTIALSFQAFLVREWIRVCQNYHSDSCNSAPNMSNLTLIDCMALELRQFSYPPAYVCLSYVWAKSAQYAPSTSASKTEECRFPPLRGLSSVIKDAISVTRELGYQYIWVDKYCINQIDEAAKIQQIDNMDLIYNGAELTIIAASGEDEHHGLPGVSSPRQTTEPFIIGDFLVRYEPMKPDRQIMLSAWAQRGWTFQEDLLSRRRLFFLPSQIFFTCGSMNCCEARSGPNLCQLPSEICHYSEKSLDSYQERNLNINHLVPVLGSRSRSLLDVLSLIQGYTRRDLTFDSDSLRAFSGVQRILETRKHALVSIQGLQIPLTKPTSPDDLTSVLASSLSWEHSIPAEARRRDLFPSWTWAGWAGLCDYSRDLAGDIMKTNLQDITFQYLDGRNEPLHDVIEALEDALNWRIYQRYNREQSFLQHQIGTLNPHRDFSNPQAIRFRGPLARRESFSFRDEDDWNTGQYLEPQIGVVPRGEFIPNQLPLSPKQFLRGLDDKSIGCIVLGLHTTNYYHVHLLLIEWIRPGEACRICKISAMESKELCSDLEEHIKTLPMVAVKLW